LNNLPKAKIIYGLVTLSVKNLSQTPLFINLILESAFEKRNNVWAIRNLISFTPYIAFLGVQIG
jgi:hypothetical protein